MQKNKFSKLPAVARYAIVIGAAVLFGVICSLVMSAVALGSEDPTANLSLYGEIIFVLSMLLCGFLGAKTESDGKIASGIIASALMLVFVIAASVAFGGTDFVKETIIAVIGAVAAVLGTLLGAREPKRKRRR